MIYDTIKQAYTEEEIRKIFKGITSKVGYLIIIAVMLYMSYHFGEEKKNDQYISDTSYPVAACDFILSEESGIDLETARFYNEYNYGSYLIYRGIPVFIDSRADLYAPEFSGKEDDIFMDFIEVSGIAQFYEDVFEKYDITHVITYSNSKMNMIIKKTEDSNYKKLYSDSYFTVYERLSATEGTD